jgi:hypothetical protein
MPSRFPFAGLFLAGVLLLLRSTAAQAEFIYDNSDTGGTNVYYSVVEYGDEIILGGTSRVISQFLFEYYGDFAPAGDEIARVRLYKNDGPKTAVGDSTPGTVLYDSGDFSLSPGYQTKAFSGLNINVPTDMTWTIQFGGLSGDNGDRAGLVFRDTPSTGSSYDDFWLKQNTGWQLFSWNGSPVANFAARIVSGSDPTRLSIRRDASKQIVVEWTGISILQVADSAAGPYTDIANARNSYKISPSAAATKFWRLRD